jgi:ABC-type Fe3+/spermidine/putrescine transport system ATPase subunit
LPPILDSRLKARQKMAGEMLAPIYETRPQDEPKPERAESLMVRGLSKTFGAERVLDDVSFSIAKGESLVLLGHSGSGKSTTLRLIAGLVTPEKGEISLNGRSIENVVARERNVGVIFQNYALFPRMTVAENIGFGLRIRKVRKRDRQEVIDRMLSLIGLSDQRDKYPSQISGGQQQRVAIARALAYEPELLLFDESFSALDPQLRVGLRRDIRSLIKKLKIPALFITHDQDEAMELGDQIAILNRGRLEQIGTPQDVYTDPKTEFVATFLGAANVIRGVWRDGFIVPECSHCTDSPGPAPGGDGERVKMIFRPEDITLSPLSGPVRSEGPKWRGEVIDVSFAGATETLTVRLFHRGNSGQLSIPAPNVDAHCDLLIKVVRTKWEARAQKFAREDRVTVSLRSYKLLRGECRE